MKALITANISKEVLNELRTLIDITYEPWRETGIIYFDANELIEKLKGYDLFITEADDLKKSEVYERTSLKLIISCRGDPFNLDLNIATRLGLPILNTPLRNVDAVAEITIGFMLMLARKMHLVDREIHSDKFEITDFDDYLSYFNKFQGIELKGKKIGIIGFGQIGRRVADRLKAFESELLIYDPYIPDKICENYGKKVELNYLMQNSDFITIHAIGTDETNNLINKDNIKLMKQSAYLLNLAKGSIIDYDALFNILKEKKIAGAALDVFPLEPIDETNEFIGLDNVIITPHIGGNTLEVIERQSQMILKDIKSWLKGEIPKNLVNPEVFKLKNVKKQESSEKLHVLKNDIVDLCKKLLDQGHVIGSAGNVSVRLKDNNKEVVLITPSNVKYEEMNLEDISVIDMEGKVIQGERNPSVEKKMHLGIYQHRKDINAIIHAHSIYSTILSSLKLSLPPIMEELVPYIGGEVLCADYGEAGSGELAKAVIDALEDRNAVLLANHGNICCGSHLEGAYTVLQYLERGSKIYYLARLLGDPNMLPEDTVDYEKDIFEVFKDSKKI
jgi:L-ribulose-5-phosphate 4-epimerase